MGAWVYVRILRLFVQVVLVALSLSVIGLSIQGMNDLAGDKRLIAAVSIRGRIQANLLVVTGVALDMTVAGIIVVAILNSIYILKDRFPQAIRKRFPRAMGIITMSLFAIIITPINVLQTYLTIRRGGRVTSSILPDAVVDSLIQITGQTLPYKDLVALIEYTVIAWIILIVLLIGVAIEFSKYSQPAACSDVKKEELGS
ncbi:hypothetical protein PGT21_002793 [Puccinia graminis f. sp. tritici]|uniref:Uncharacterized protein n=1 Tax=Puccinia graminis f. sp. tritici TaxID=56615 RepID=A0A5B0NGA2_PUCGR|nr:hypothetical protein PGTUg99_015273 [Puccinia graminis f. sp. tritici]KAA1105314.1 hypothetical protein PGT21_002793 [Puccinia graminis f. sp. tritici]